MISQDFIRGKTRCPQREEAWWQDGDGMRCPQGFLHSPSVGLVVTGEGTDAATRPQWGQEETCSSSVTPPPPRSLSR